MSTETESGIPENWKTDLFKWFQLRFWLVAVLLTAVNFFGGKAIISEAVRDGMNNELAKMDAVTQKTTEVSTEAKVITRETSLVLKEVKTETERYAQAVMDLRQNIRTLTATSEVVAKEFLRLQQKLEGENKHIKGTLAKDMEILQQRLAQLQNLVVALAENIQEGSSALRTYNTEVKLGDKRAKAENERFEENSRYRVNMYFMDDKPLVALSKTVENQLVQMGYKTSSLSIARAEEFQMAVQSLMPFETLQMADNLKALKVNVIIYTPDAGEKAKAIRGLLTEKNQGIHWELMPRSTFALRFPSLLIGHLTKRDVTNIVEIFFVKAK